MFKDDFREICAGQMSTDVASKLAADGFGIVPGTGSWRDGRIVTRKGAHEAPLYDFDVFSGWLSDPSVPRGCPYYLALGSIGSADDGGMLTIVDIDNGHGDGDAIAFDDLWERVSGFMTDLGCPEATHTALMRTPHDGIHLLYRSDAAKLFRWLAGAKDARLGDEVSVDWLTPTGKQNATGPGCLRPCEDGERRYDLYVPADMPDDDVAKAVAEMPTPLLRWLVARHVESRKGRVARCFSAELGLEAARSMPDIADLLRPARSASRKTTQAVSSDGVSLYKAEDIAEAGTRHVRLMSFAGECVHKVTGATYDETLDLIRAEIVAFGQHRCHPAYDENDADVRGALDAVAQWASEARDEIEARISHRVAVVSADGEQTMVVARDFAHRVVNGATYRCKPRKNGQPGTPICSPTNVIAALEQDEGLKGCFGYDSMSCRDSIVRPLPWSPAGEDYPRFVTDADRARIISYIDETASFNPTRDFATAFSSVCARHAFNPLVDFVHSFDGIWDGKDHITTLIADWMGVEPDDDVDGRSFSGACLTVWMRGAIRRALHPGCKFDYTILLTGPQGIGKTTFWSRLAGRDDWLCESLTDIRDDKKCFEQISASWIVIIDELAALRSAKDVTRVKTYLSARWDDHRKPYSREQERIARHVAFCGTSNELTFLADRSGNRRFLVIPCVGVMDDKSLPVLCSSPDFVSEVRQAWAQAYAMEMARPDEALVLPRWAMEWQESRNEAASVVDPLDERLSDFFSAHRLTDDPVCYEQIYAWVYGCPREDYLREKHLKSFQDATRRAAKAAGWTFGRYRSTWGIPNGERTRARGFHHDLTDEERAERDSVVSEAKEADTLIPMSQLVLYDAMLS